MRSKYAPHVDASLSPPNDHDPFRGAGKALAAGGTVSGIAALVADVLAPLWPITAILFCLAAVLLAACLFVAFVPRWKERATQLLGPAWRTTYLGFLGVSIVILGAAMGLNLTAEGDRGVLAQHVGAFGDLQQTLSIVEDRTETIAADTGQIRQDTAQIREDTSAIRGQIGGVAQETSDDPRKELANIGIDYTTKAYVEALMTGDERAVRLFLAGGMKADTMHDASAVLYILQPTTPDPIPMLQLLVDEGFDPNTNLFDPVIMDNWAEQDGSIPMGFEHEDLPGGYIYESFRGPALLWVVMLAGYIGPSESDYRVIEFLLETGADPTITKAFLAQEIFVDSDYFSTYADLRDFIEERT